MVMHFLQGGYSPSTPGGAASDYYGSIGYGTTYGAMTFGQMSWRGSQAQLWRGPGSPPPTYALYSNGPSLGSSPSTPSPARAHHNTNGRLLTTPRQVKALTKARNRSRHPQDQFRRSSAPISVYATQTRPVPMYVSTTMARSPPHTYFTSLPSMYSKRHKTPKHSVPMTESANGVINLPLPRQYHLISNNYWGGGPWTRSKAPVYIKPNLCYISL